MFHLDSDYRNMRTTCLVITTKCHWSVCDKRRYTSVFLIWLVQQLFTVICTQIRYNTIRDAILMCAQKPTWVSLIYRMVHAVHNTAWNTHTRFLLKQETVSGSGISWAICKSAPSSRQTNTPAPHHSFYKLDDLPATQPTASKHWRQHGMDQFWLTLSSASRKSSQLRWCPADGRGQNYDKLRWQHYRRLHCLAADTVHCWEWPAVSCYESCCTHDTGQTAHSCPCATCSLPRRTSRHTRRCPTDSHANQYQTHSHTHPFNGPLTGTIRVSRYQKGKTNLDFTEARYSEWQWHQLGRKKCH